MSTTDRKEREREKGETEKRRWREEGETIEEGGSATIGKRSAVALTYGVCLWHASSSLSINEN